MKRRNKYGAVKTTVDGITFDSKREARRYGELKLLEKVGTISNLKLQPAFKLACGPNPVLIRSNGYPNGRQATYRADFSYNCSDGHVVEDVKGGAATDTPVSRLKRAMMEAQHGVKVEIV